MSLDKIYDNLNMKKWFNLMLQSYRLQLQNCFTFRLGNLNKSATLGIMKLQNLHAWNICIKQTGQIYNVFTEFFHT